MSFYVGTVAPAVYTRVLSIADMPELASLDFTTVTAAVFHVKSPDRTLATWTAVRSGATTSSLTLTHAFLSGDLFTPGAYEVYAVLTVPGGTPRTSTRVLQVLDEYDADV
jgi:hypothetical protein